MSRGVLLHDGRDEFTCVLKHGCVSVGEARRGIKQVVAGAAKGVFHQQYGKYIGHDDHIVRDGSRQHQGDHHAGDQCRNIMGVVALQPQNAAQPFAQHAHRHGNDPQHNGPPAIVKGRDEVKGRHAQHHIQHNAPGGGRVLDVRRHQGRFTDHGSSPPFIFCRYSRISPATDCREGQI